MFLAHTVDDAVLVERVGLCDREVRRDDHFDSFRELEVLSCHLLSSFHSKSNLHLSRPQVPHPAPSRFWIGAAHFVLCHSVIHLLKSA